MDFHYVMDNTNIVTSSMYCDRHRMDFDIGELNAWTTIASTRIDIFDCMHTHTCIRTHATVAGWTKQSTQMYFVRPSFYHWCWICCSSAILYVCCSWNYERQPGHKVEHHHGIYCKHFGTLDKLVHYVHVLSFSPTLCPLPLPHLSFFHIWLCRCTLYRIHFFAAVYNLNSIAATWINSVCVQIHCPSAFWFSEKLKWNFHSNGKNRNRINTNTHRKKKWFICSKEKRKFVAFFFRSVEIKSQICFNFVEILFHLRIKSYLSKKFEDLSLN